MCYAPGLLGYSAVKIASPTFYSLRDSRTPVIVSVLSVIAEPRPQSRCWCAFMGYRGLALGTARRRHVQRGDAALAASRPARRARRAAERGVAFAKILAASIADGRRGVAR